MKRAPYFAIKGIAFLVLVQLHHIALQLLGSALVGEYLWALIAGLCVGYFLYGFVLVRLSAARSLDAFGRGDFALLVLIPLLSLILTFKRSKGDTAVPSWGGRGFLKGEMGVFVGLATFVLAIALQNYIEQELPKRISAAESSNPLAGDFLRWRVRKAAVGLALPKAYYLGTQAVGAEQRNNELHLHIVSGRPTDHLTKDAQDIIARKTCMDPDIQWLIKAGIIWVLDFQDDQGAIYSSVALNAASCPN